MRNMPIDRNALARKLRRGVDAVHAAERRSRELPEDSAREYVKSANHALVTIVEAVANDLDTERFKVDL